MTQQASDKPTRLKVQEEQYAKKLVAKRLLLGKADGPMESRFATERFELESDIKVLEIMLYETKQEILKLENIKPDIS